MTKSIYSESQYHNFLLFFVSHNKFRKPKLCYFDKLIPKHRSRSGHKHIIVLFFYSEIMIKQNIKT